MDIISIIIFATAVINLIFAGIIFTHGRKEITTAIYSLFIFAVGIWNFSIYLMIEPTTPLWLFELATKFHFVGGQFGFFCFFLFSVFYPKRIISFRFPFFLTIINFIVVGVILSSSLFIQPMQNLPVWSERVQITTLGFWILVLSLSICYVSATVLMFKNLTTATGVERGRIKYFLLSVAVSGFIGFFTSLILPFYGDFRFFAITPIIVTIILVGVGSFILIKKYKFFDVRVVVTEIFVLSLWALFLGKIFLTHSPEERFGDLLLFAVTVIFGIMIIKSSRKEVEQSDRLADLNLHLQDKVDEQTKEIKVAYEVEKKARIKLEDLDKVKDEFITTAAHQLRTPLSANRWALKSFLDGSLGKTVLNDIQKDLLEKTYNSNNNLIGIVGDLLDTSSIENKKFTYDFKETEISLLLKEVVSKSIFLMREKKIKINYHEPEDHKIMMKVDEDKLSMALGNLMSNAVDYTPDGGEIDVTLRKDNNQLIIEIKDTGIGISSEDQPHIFEKFYRGDNAKKTETDRSGLGLYISKQIIEKHGGTITIDSKEGEGTAVVISMRFV